MGSQGVGPLSHEIKAGLLPGGGQLPLVLSPGTIRDAAGLSEWLAAHREWLAGRLREHGALLVRGFPVEDPAAFERVARALSPELKNDYLGTSPRNGLTDYVFSASELPPYYPIPQHCEMSFLPHPPARLFFCCLIPSSGPGGETPLTDFRAVYRDLDPAVRERFVSRGVRNIRNYCGPEGGSRLDLWKLKRWDEMFHTTDPAEVEARCREHGLSCTFRPGGRLCLTNVQPAVRPHPETGVPVWFNHSQIFHLSSVPDEYRRIAERLGQRRYGVLSRVAQAAVFVRRRFTSIEEQAMHCSYGDGSPIEDADMDRVRDAIWRNLVCFRWQRGDVVAIDNFAVAHGRMPYRGPRQVAVCWA